MNRQILEQPFPPSLVKVRKARNGKQLSYVEGAEYIKRLNEAFDGNWSFEIVEHQIESGEVIVLGRLTADGVTKSAFGGSSVTVARETGAVISIADDLKAAATDALKKACSLLGIGLHMYSTETAPSQPEQQPAKPVPKDRLTQKQLAAIWSIARNLGMSSDDARRRSIKAFNCIPEHLTKAEASSLIQELSEEQRGAA